MKNPDEKVNIEAFNVKKKKLYFGGGWGGGAEVTDLYVIITEIYHPKLYSKR